MEFVFRAVIACLYFLLLHSSRTLCGGTQWKTSSLLQSDIYPDRQYCPVILTRLSNEDLLHWPAIFSMNYTYQPCENSDEPTDVGPERGRGTCVHPETDGNYPRARSYLLKKLSRGNPAVGYGAGGDGGGGRKGNWKGFGPASKLSLPSTSKGKKGRKRSLSAPTHLESLNDTDRTSRDAEAEETASKEPNRPRTKGDSEDLDELAEGFSKKLKIESVYPKGDYREDSDRKRRRGDGGEETLKR